MDRRPIWVLLLAALFAAPVGAAICGMIGFYSYTIVFPRHGGCGDIGCWDALGGAFAGVIVGGLAAPIATVLVIRRRRRGSIGPHASGDRE